MDLPWAIKDIATVGISTLALLISFLSFYLNLIYKKYSLVCTIASWRTEDEADQKCSACQIALCNNGNKSLLIRAIDIDFIDQLETDMLPELEPEELPVILKAGEQKLVHINVPKYFLAKALKNARKLKFTISVYTIEGELRVAEKEFSPIAESQEPNPEDWKPFIMKKPKQVHKT